MPRDLTEAEIQAILEESSRRPRLDYGPRGVRTYYDAETRRVMVEYDNGCLFGFPVDIVPGTEGASAEQLSAVELLGPGNAVGWRNINASASLNGLMLHVFRARAWAGRYLGATTSPAKAEAARRNGLKGGRPRKKKAPEAAD